MERSIDGVSLPADASPLSADKSASPFAGIWFGTWGGWRKTILIVESINDDGSAKVIYAIAENQQSGQKPAWYRFNADISGEKMIVRGGSFTVSYVLTRTGRLLATFGDSLGFGVMLRQKPDALTRQNASFRWDAGYREFLRTGFIEGGQAIELETIIFTPPGKGPFPLAVVNHGSTGVGDNKAAFKETWSDPWFAEFLNARGWMVAFPQRRGRGKSGGLYDEGFGEDRSRGYTCNTRRSLAGADRAMEDLAAAIEALRQRPDVQAGPLLLAGNSRGGILSAAFAGTNPEQVRGVINFVGGWIGEGCPTAEEINQTLFNKGSAFREPMLWLHGKDDYFYSIEHSRENFASFESNGGKGVFMEITVPGRNNGHWVMAVPPLWEKHVSDYLDMIRR